MSKVIFSSDDTEYTNNNYDDRDDSDFCDYCFIDSDGNHEEHCPLSVMKRIND